MKKEVVPGWLCTNFMIPAFGVFSLIPLIEETLTNSVQNEGEADDKKAIYRAAVGSFLG
jgi:hypothetical protein